MSLDELESGYSGCANCTEPVSFSDWLNRVAQKVGDIIDTAIEAISDDFDSSDSESDSSERLLNGFTNEHVIRRPLAPQSRPPPPQSPPSPPSRPPQPRMSPISPAAAPFGVDSSPTRITQTTSQLRKRNVSSANPPSPEHSSDSVSSLESDSSEEIIIVKKVE